jgi:pyruvate/2-oxoglutarate dehydrogenase complex dihydrolipoamide acyltransferase (E2) component
MLLSMQILRPSAIFLILAVVAVLASGCGGADSEAKSGSNSANERDAAQVKFRSCMRENGVDLPDNPGQGGGGPGRDDIDRAALEKAQKACQKYQKEAFGDVSPDQREEFQDAFAKFSSCMRKHDVDVPDPGAGGGGPPAGGGNQIDRDDPKVQAAMKACQDQLPQGRGPGGPGGPGGGNDGQ